MANMKKKSNNEFPEGCWLDSARGWADIGEQIQSIAMEYGWKGMDGTEVIIPSDEEGDEFQYAVDEAEDYLNSLPNIPDGFYFGGNDNGDWGLWQMEEGWDKSESDEDAMDDAMQSDYESSLENTSKKNKNMKNTLSKVFEKTSAVQDSTDVWKAVRDYILSRTGDRFNTIEEMTDDVNERYKSVMSQIQQSYDNWFEGELKSNYHVYDIEILGDDSDIVVEDDMSNEVVDENGMGQEDEMNDDINLEDDTENMQNH